jgi:hypothetical protein
MGTRAGRFALGALVSALPACSTSSAGSPSGDAGPGGTESDASIADASSADATTGVPSSTDASASDPSACADAGTCLYRFTLPGTTFTLPYYATSPIDQANSAITRVVVFNQGLDRDAANDFETILKGAATAGALATTLLLTPHFEALQNADGTACSGNADTPAATDLLWTCDAWSDGLAATNDSAVTSYGALDAMLTSVLTTFPALTRVTVSGFSAGGQLTQRYVAANRVDPGASGTPFRYVIGDPSSYLYFDDRRPANAANCTPSGCPDGFLTFTDADGGCPGFNDWKYGTDALVGAAASLTPTQLEGAYIARRVTYVLGMLDNAATTAADDSQLDVTCPAEAQGPFRYQRGLAYYAYATGLLDAGGSQLFTVPGCAHSPSCVFQSDAGVAAVFGE